ncbi:hypothetical protein HALLA_08325 [Halostagnicola larsenii XH-48]|uniref:DUF7577 domain-containing protein n=2 Tax=Halostagnicola larsenii TaxID=353800 RepID=W0JU42_9EURY|nr:hypothetical protein HALLA_08325 [Halostagnicola larsenii XH-48]
MRNPEQPASCPYCGTANDFVFTYCRDCLGELPSSPTADPEAN